ncbi:MAG: aldose 1-epimerase family protein [Bifidobacteriaceae bacterium]|jgi:aldose 1-epimerase|nr:aldose 1-epimerase family protein [Bifidobacteriaceae bacterium]
MDSSLSQVRPASGRQFAIEAGPYRAVIASVGATLRVLTRAGRDLVVPFAADQVRPFYRGATLAPWPNRVIDGRYRLADQLAPGATAPPQGAGPIQQLPLTEPARGHALHGLALWLDFAVVAQSAEAVSLAQVIEPQAGYPFRLALQVTCRLDPTSGLTWELITQNIGSGRAPHGAGPHPYLVAGPGPLDEWRLTLPVGSFIEVEPERLTPVGRRPVAGSRFDFRAPRAIGGAKIDHCFGDVAWDASGRARAAVEHPAGGGAAISWDGDSPWLQVHTADQPTPELDRLGLALEPMTCPPDAFNSGQDLIWLEPGQSHRVAWTIEGW